MRTPALALLLSSALVAAVATGSTALPQQVQNTLTTIDTVPTKQQLDDVFNGGPAALSSLSTIARDLTADIGIRLRAIHALAKYCGDAEMQPAVPCTETEESHLALTTVLAENSGPDLTGAPLLLLRASIETLGVMHVSTDVGVLVPLLDHPSRDIRASTAHALRDLCNTSAITWLRSRYSHESTDQVRLSISEALRILGQCP